MGLRKRFLTISSCLMAAIVLCAVVLGVHLDTEFTGGAMITLSYEGSFTMSDVQKVASSALENNGLTLQTGENVATGGQTLKISMPGTETVTTEQVAKLLDSLNESCPDNNFEQLSLSNVSAAMGTKFLQKSLVAVVFALVLILLYIALRFKNIGGLTGGMMAVLALVNDLMVVFGTFVLLRTALDGNFIAAMLTILGYSINDTVVVYDRIRENRTLMGKKASFEELVEPLGEPVRPPHPDHHHYHGDGAGRYVHRGKAVWSGQHLYLYVPADDGHDQRRVHFAVRFHLCVGAVE